MIFGDLLLNKTFFSTASVAFRGALQTISPITEFIRNTTTPSKFWEHPCVAIDTWWLHGVVWCCEVLRGGCMVLHGVARCCMVVAWCCKVLHGVARCCMVVSWCCKVLHGVGWCCEALHGVARCCMVVAWWLHGGCMVVAWWLHGGCMVL